MEQSNNVGLKSRFWVLKKCKNVFSITAVHNFIYTTTNNFSVVNLLRKEHICPLMAISLNSKRTVFLQLVIIVLVGMFFFTVRLPPSITKGPIRQKYYRSDDDITLECAANGVPKPRSVFEIILNLSMV